MMLKPLKVSASRPYCATTSRILCSSMSVKFRKCLGWKHQKSVKFIPLSFHIYFFNFCMGTPKGGDTSKNKNHPCWGGVPCQDENFCLALLNGGGVGEIPKSQTEECNFCCSWKQKVPILLCFLPALRESTGNTTSHTWVPFYPLTSFSDLATNDSMLLVGNVLRNSCLSRLYWRWKISKCGSIADLLLFVTHLWQ